MSLPNSRSLTMKDLF